MAKKDLVVNIDSKTRGLEQGVSKSVNEVRKLEQQTRKSKNEFKQFDDRVGKLASGNLSGLLGTMGNVAGILGVAKLAQEGFNKTMRASQTTSDAFDVAIGQATTSVDYFFTALSTGNFENFFQGITSAIAYSRELTTILDGLGDMKFADRFFLAEENYELEKNRAIINAPDGEYSQEQKKQALEDNKAIIADMEKRSKIIAEDSKRARVAKFQEATATLNSEQETVGYDLSFLYQKRKMKEYSDLENHYREEFGMRPGDFDFPEEAQKELDALLDNLGTSQDEIINYLFDTIYSGVNLNYKKFEQYQRQLDENKPVVDSKTSSSGSAMGGASRTVTSKDSNLKYEEAKKELELLGDDVREEYIKFYEIKNVIGDKVIEEMVKLREQEFDRKSTIERLRNTQNRLAKRVQGEKGEIKPPEESIAGIDKEISDLNKKISLSVNEEDRRNLYKQIEELQAKKLEIETKYKAELELPQDSLAAIDKRIQELNKEISLSINDRERRELYKEIEELKKQKIMIEVIYSLPDIEKQSKYATVSNPFEKGLDALNSKKGIVMPNIEKPLSSMQVWNNTMNKIREDNWATIESFNGIAQSMSAIGGATKGSTAEMFQWAATTLSAIGQAIPVIMALTAAKEVEAQANAKAAVTGVASSVASIPIVGGILATGAIASVTAALLSIPKFADGGIVYGNTLAQVGEYSGVSNNPEVIAPLSKLRDILADTQQNNGVGGVVDFRIAGKELVGVINNYSSKQRKK